MSSSTSTTESSPTSSLLHMNRPTRLAPIPSTTASASMPKADSESGSSILLRTTSQRPSQRTGSSASSNSKPNAIASTSRGPSYLNLDYLNVDPTTSSSDDQATADLSPVIAFPSAMEQSTSSLSAIQDGIMCEVMSRQQWQPDTSSAFCSYSMCTAQFAPTDGYASYFFSSGHRRHHCRKCGLLFCDNHTSQRAPMSHVHHGKRVVSKERVCDNCLPPPVITLSAERTRRGSAWSQSTASTVPSENVLTPNQDSGIVESSMVLSRTSTRANLEVNVEPEELAPIEPWMGPAGILSLYPLAVVPSHAPERTKPAPSAKPLFAPSPAARRTAMEKTIEKLSLRQRRMGDDKSFWIPHEWGFRREDFDANTNEDSDDEERPVEFQGGFIVEGPIRYRPGHRKSVTPARTPSEERTGIDWHADH